MFSFYYNLLLLFIIILFQYYILKNTNLKYNFNIRKIREKNNNIERIFNTLFWFIAVPIMIVGLKDGWNKRSYFVRTITAFVIIIIILWHLLVTLQDNQNKIISTELSWQLEIVSIIMGLILAIFGFSTPNTILTLVLGMIGVIICIGHGSVLLGLSNCYYIC